jgi:hypothetical protein
MYRKGGKANGRSKTGRYEKVRKAMDTERERESKRKKCIQRKT